jgi:hypothetical protein
MQVRPVGGAAGCLTMILASVVLSVVLTVLLNLVLRWRPGVRLRWAHG